TTRAWWAQNAAVPADQRLISPVIALPAGDLPLVLAFDAYHQYEVNGAANCYDGGFVEISTDGVNWLPLGNDRNLADPYLGIVTTGSSNPGGGNQGWCRQPPGGQSIQTVFLLDDFVGQNVQFRFRSTADANTVGASPAGWGVDNVLVQSCED
ncbi:MAG TPA: hypothetical protein VKN35_02365, partial [Xanthomonadales bacterium]|nr:hypothetical protein [Xanthomonadales bacterium]